jgi:2,3-bisphosphoglycerate-dependent phosphoglycerate mutase
MHLYFIRHAQSENNAKWEGSGSDYGRTEDPELTELGLQQASILAEHLLKGNPRGGRKTEGSVKGGFGITHLYSSLMVRSVRTGALISTRIGIPLHGWEEIHERGGIYLDDPQTGEARCLPGKGRAYFEANYPNFVLPPTFTDKGWWNERPVERPEDCLARARAFIHGLREKHGGTSDRVAIVSHGGFYNDLLYELLGLSSGNGTWFWMFNTAISRIDFRGNNEIALVYQNRTDHLPEDLIT